jgi:hypothetical protein
MEPLRRTRAVLPMISSHSDTLRIVMGNAYSRLMRMLVCVH